jgi:hypothetical protein
MVMLWYCDWVVLKPWPVIVISYLLKRYSRCGASKVAAERRLILTTATLDRNFYSRRTYLIFGYAVDKLPTRPTNEFCQFLTVEVMSKTFWTDVTYICTNRTVTNWQIVDLRIAQVGLRASGTVERSFAFCGAGLLSRCLFYGGRIFEFVSIYQPI